MILSTTRNLEWMLKMVKKNEQFSLHYVLERKKFLIIWSRHVALNMHFFERWKLIHRHDMKVWCDVSRSSFIHCCLYDVGSVHDKKIWNVDGQKFIIIMSCVFNYFVHFNENFYLIIWQKEQLHFYPSNFKLKVTSKI